MAVAKSPEMFIYDPPSDVTGCTVLMSRVVRVIDGGGREP